MNSRPIDALEVPVEALRRVCKPLDADVDRDSSVRAPLGQERAEDALRFGTRIRQPGYNIYLLGEAGAGRHRIAEDFAGVEASKRPVPGDWCYVHNFAKPDTPQALHFPAGEGRKFRSDMQGLIEELRVAIPAAFESEDYRNQAKALENEAQAELRKYWQDLEERAAEDDIGVLQTPSGFVLAPIRKGQVLSEEEFNKLPDDEREAAQAAIRRLSDSLEEHIEGVPRMQKHFRERIKALNRSVIEHAVGILLEDLKASYRDQAAVVDYLAAVEEAIVANANDFRDQEAPQLPFMASDSRSLFSEFEVNLLVSNEAASEAPVIYEPNPSYQNVIGKVEHRAEMGALLTDFRMIRAGALHRANGGFLILDAHRVLTRPFVWEALKQALTARQVRIESPGETWGLFSTSTLQPEPIPLDVKIVLIGERSLYYLLAEYDSEFLNLFKVAADLDDDVERTERNTEACAALIATRAEALDLLPFSGEAVARIVEERARDAGDSERLSMHMRSLDDLLTEADYWARQRDTASVQREDIARAVDEQRRRLGRVQSRIAESIEHDVRLIDTSGSRVGQVNGLAVLQLGETSFGHPVRITATTRLGSGDVVDIERESELGGAIHSKGVMILSAALAARYAPDEPFSLQAHLVFEQSYGTVEGDSASVAEYCALLSSLAGVAIRQNLAVTGSVNQLGRVQVIGGVNEKIEGFFEICRNRGLDGTHGVVIPRDNLRHLMLRPDVVRAVEQGEFHVYAVTTIDEALALLTGEPAGERDAAGRFPADSVNGRVEAKLLDYAEQRKKLSAGDGEDSGD